MIEEALHQVLVVEAVGEGRLAQLLDLMYLGDWTSLRPVTPAPPNDVATLTRRRHHRAQGLASPTPDAGCACRGVQKWVLHQGSGCAANMRSVRATAPVVSSRTRPAFARVVAVTPPR
jgi:hypothetical protein